MTARFTLTYDYLCPFAHIASETVAEALDAGAGYEVLFTPFSLHQNSLGDEATAVWDDPDGVNGPGVRAILWSLAVRDVHPDKFLAFHTGVFSARHDDGVDLSDSSALASVAESAGLDVESIDAAVESGVPMKNLRTEHTWLAEEYAVFGVPTFIAGDEAVFVRFMERHAQDDLRRVVEMLSWTNLNEFKRTSIPR
jgi:protein-disulfide isomerase-like protein with CxxC motif